METGTPAERQIIAVERMVRHVRQLFSTLWREPRMSTPHGRAASPFKQPKAVWAVAFACVISFMGIGLVDPILPALAENLHASPARSRCSSAAT